MMKKRVFSLFLVFILCANMMCTETIIASNGEIQESANKESENTVMDNDNTENTGQENSENEGVIATGTDLGLTCKSAILMEASTGGVIYEHNADEVLSPASITKIMTLILIFKAIDEGKIQLTDPVTTSAYAKSMGGSQVFLEEGEIQTVETLIKCIVIASGNDASVAMAEHIAGSETEFVNQMNEMAKELGMNNTYFKDCCGLNDTMEHHTSARDVAIMSRELITRYPEIFEYSGIWMENITHVTDKGTSEFGLANTNKLLKQYQYATGLKTGSTSLAKYCLSATARKENIDLIAVVMAAPDYKVRFSEAVALLNYGFANVRLYRSINDDKLSAVKVTGGIEDKVECRYSGDFSYLALKGENIDNIEKRIELEKSIQAPVEKGDKVGVAAYYLGDNKLGEVDIVADNSVEKAGFGSCFTKVWRMFGI